MSDLKNGRHDLMCCMWFHEEGSHHGKLKPTSEGGQWHMDICQSGGCFASFTTARHCMLVCPSKGSRDDVPSVKHCG